MTYAILTCETKSCDWKVAAICATTFEADSKMGRVVVDPTLKKRDALTTVAKVVLHTARNVGNFVDTREFTVIKSHLV